VHARSAASPSHSHHPSDACCCHPP
jgi:hypothetical protein